MRILFLTPRPFIPEYFSGPNRTLHELCEYLVTMGHEPFVLAGSHADDPSEEIKRDHSFSFPLFRAVSPINSLLPLSLSLFPDIIVLTGDATALLPKALDQLDLPMVVWLFQGFLKNMENTHFPDTVLLLASSPFVARRIHAKYGLSSKIVEPFVDTQRYRNPECSGKRILFVNPIPEKGVEIAFSLARLFPRLLFTFVESNTISQSWRSICFERAAQCGNIEWICRTPDMASVLRRSRLLLLPRFSEEGGCRLISEAQHAGVPVLASDRGGIPEQVQTGGTIVPVDEDINEWRKWLEKYCKDEQWYTIQKNNALRQAEQRPQKKQTADGFLAACAAHIKKCKQDNSIRNRIRSY